MKNLRKKIVFITGASSGFGKAIAYKLAERGCNLIITARRLDRLIEIAKNISSKYPVEILPLKLDVRNYDEVKNLVSTLPLDWKRIEILINNAGLSRGLNKMQEGVLEDWDEMIDTNVKGLLYVTKEVLPLMLKNETGHIVNIGSIAGHEVYPAGNVYCASKHAVDAITKGLRLDLLGTSVKVTTIDPGLAETEFSIVRFRGDKKRAEDVYEGYEPLQPEDIADAVDYAVTRDDRVNVAEMILFPKSQASSMHVYKNK